MALINLELKVFPGIFLNISRNLLEHFSESLITFPGIKMITFPGIFSEITRNPCEHSPHSVSSSCIPGFINVKKKTDIKLNVLQCLYTIAVKTLYSEIWINDFFLNCFALIWAQGLGAQTGIPTSKTLRIRPCY